MEFSIKQCILSDTIYLLFFTYLSDTIYYDRDGHCVNYASGGDALVDLFKVGGRCDVEIDFNKIDDAEIEKVRP